MINNKFKKGIEDIKKVALTAQEKESMLARIKALQGVPSSFGTPVKSPWTLSASVVAASLIALVSGGLLAYAAEGSLPGNPLYAFKVNVSEPLQNVLTFSEIGKVELAASRVEKRLNEEKTLAIQGKLDPVKKVELQASISASLKDLDVAVKASSPSRQEAAQTVRASVEERVTVQVQKIKEILERPKKEEKKREDNSKRDDAPKREDNSNRNDEPKRESPPVRVIPTEIKKVIEKTVEIPQKRCRGNCGNDNDRRSSPSGNDRRENSSGNNNGGGSSNSSGSSNGGGGGSSIGNTIKSLLQ